jgi:hypothetical protein
MKYALLIYSPVPADHYTTTTTRARQPYAEPGAWGDYTREARQAGVLVAAEQLTHSETATSVRVAGKGRLVTDGPFMETKENLLGFYLIDVDSLDEALDWAHRMPAHDGQVIEVRAALSGMPWQREL